MPEELKNKCSTESLFNVLLIFSENNCRRAKGGNDVGGRFSKGVNRESKHCFDNVLSLLDIFLNEKLCLIDIVCCHGNFQRDDKSPETLRGLLIGHWNWNWRALKLCIFTYVHISSIILQEDAI